MAYFHEHQLLPLERTSETFHDLCHQDIAEGTILTACQELAEQVAPVQEAVKDYLTYTAQVVRFDESGARVMGLAFRFLRTALLPCFYVITC